MDFHILTQDVEKKAVNAVFHLPVPGTGTNQAGIQWRNAVVMELGGAAAITSILTNITSDELALLKTGAVIEIQDYFRFSSTALTDVQRLTQIKARFTSLKTSVIAEKQITLAFMGGYAGNEV